MNRILTKEELIEFLKIYGCENVRLYSKNESFSRTILFEVYNRTYTIIWYCNQSTLFIGDLTREKRLPQIPFRYIKYDTCYPVSYNGNSNISFSYAEDDRGDLPYGRFILPIDKP